MEMTGQVARLFAIVLLLTPGIVARAQPADAPAAGAPAGDNAPANPPDEAAPAPPAQPETQAPPAPSAAAPSNAPAAPSSEAAPKPKPPNLETLDANDARAVLGSRVSGTAGEDMGVVVDVLFDQAKQPRAAVIDFGGFLGVGTRKIAIDWRLLQFQPEGAKTPIKLDLARADVQAAPEYKTGAKSIDIVVLPPQSKAAPASEASGNEAAPAAASPPTAQ